MFYVEEPIFGDGESYSRSKFCPQTGVRVLTPVISADLKGQEVSAQVQALLKLSLEQNAVDSCVSWFYTPMAMHLHRLLPSRLTVYDCMDELSAFAGAPPAMQANEKLLFQQADLVFTGGSSLFESKRNQHRSVHLFPSSVDLLHFSTARTIREEPADQQVIQHPRLGYAGVIDERMDLDLIHKLASSHPSWQIVLIGPVVKINPELLPRASNIHYLGMKHYSELPAYLAGWDVALLPFALNESTRFISPTKTPEYLAAGIAVVSTAIRDVVKPYGELGLVTVGSDVDEFIHSVERQLANPVSEQEKERIIDFLSQSSWDKTWSEMDHLVNSKMHARVSNCSSDGQDFTTTLDAVTERVSHV